MNPIPTIDNGRVVYDPSSILNKTMELSSTLDSFYNLTPPSSASSLSSNDTQNGSNLEKHAIESDELKKHRKQKHLEKNKIAGKIKFQCLTFSKLRTKLGNADKERKYGSKSSPKGQSS